MMGFFKCSKQKFFSDGDCYEDNIPRVWPYFASLGDQTLTIEKCIDLCEGFSYAGVQNGDGCACGNDYPDWELKRSQGSCNVPCPADDSQLCGGWFRFNIYQVAAKPPAPHKG